MLPSDMVDTLTLPFSSYYGPQQAHNPMVTDGYFQLYPLKYYTEEAYRAGHFAFWNPLILNGYPQYLEGMWTYNVLLFLPFSFLDRFQLLLILPLLVAGFGCYRLLRAFDVRISVARIFATAYMLNALFITHLLSHFLPAAMSFAPWVLLGLQQYAVSKRVHSIAFAGAMLALGFLAGNIQSSAMLVCSVAIFAAPLFWRRRDFTNAKKILVPIAVIAIGFALSAMYWLPMIEFVSEVVSHGVIFSTSLYRGYDFVQRVLSFPLLLTFFLPQLSGSTDGVMLHSAVGVFPIDFEGAIGFFPLLIAVFGVWRLRKNRSIHPFASLLILGLLIPIATPFSKYLYHRFFAVFVLGATGVGAITFESLLERADGRAALRKLLRCVTVLLVAIGTGVLAFTILTFLYRSEVIQIAIRLFGERLHHAAFAEGNEIWLRDRIQNAVNYFNIFRFEWYTSLTSCLLVIFILHRWLTNRISERSLTVFLWLITTFQVALFARSWLPMTDISKFPLYPNTPETSLLKARENRVNFFRQIEPNHQTIFVDNQSVVYGIAEATGYESLTPRCLYNAIGVNPDSATIHLLSRFAVGTIGTTHALQNGLLTILQSRPIWMCSVANPTPRAFLCTESKQVANDSTALALLRSADLAWPSALFTQDEHVQLIGNTIDSTAHIASIRTTGQSMMISTETHAPSYLVLTDTYYPGWRCDIDGKETSILRCNYAMRAIVLPAGKHAVAFYFAPPLFRVGLIITCSTCLALFSILLYFWQVQKRGANDARTHF